MNYDILIEVASSNDRAASQLTKELLDTVSGIVEKSQITNQNDSQDFGTILAIVLGSAAIVEVAKGIADRIRRDRNSTVILKAKNGNELEISGVSEQAAVEILEFLKDA